MNNSIIKSCLLALTIFSFSGCQKFLDHKPDAKLVVPENERELQALLDNSSAMNNTTSLGECSSDNYYITTDAWNSLTRESEKNLYTWGEEVVFADYPNDWSRLYIMTYNANIALEYIHKIKRTKTNETSWDNVKGSALFFRARALHAIATVWAKGYHKESAASDLGVPVRLNPDFNITSVRHTLEENYSQMISDLKAACSLLPEIPTHVMRPSKEAAYALLARVYLSMGDFKNALQYSDSSLQINNTLLDFNSLNASENNPVRMFNDEVIFHSVVTLPQLLNNVRAIIDSNLYHSFQDSDLRKKVFFRSNGNGTYGFKGSYNGSIILFAGIARDEVILTRAECYARTGQVAEAINDLNTLLTSRWEAGRFVPYSVSDKDEALELILIERRKELVMRDLRWMDIKRLNMLGEKISIRRVIDNNMYELPPNDNRFALPIPAYVIDLTGLEQNPR